MGECIGGKCDGDGVSVDIGFSLYLFGDGKWFLKYLF